MSDDKNPTIKNEKSLDPTRSGEDFIGDTTGMTGITTGNAQKTSATPTDIPKDEDKDHLPGGLLPDKKAKDVEVVANEAIDDKEYKKNLQNGMSEVAANTAEDIATEDDIKEGTQELEDTAPSISASATIGDVREPHAPVKATVINKDAKGVNIKNAAGDDSPNSDRVNTETAPYQQTYNQGEQSVSGSMPDPTSDDDTLANAHGVGEQLGENEDEDNPQEVDIARDVDAAEEHIRTH